MYCCIRTEWLCNIFVYFLLQVKHHKAMVCNGGRYQIKKLDEKNKTSDSGIPVVFKVTLMFHIELKDIQKSQKINTMGIWKILYSVTLNPLGYFYSFSNGTGYD